MLIENSANSSARLLQVLQPDILQVFSWYRDLNLVSVSADPTSLPNVYDEIDVGVLSGLNRSDYKPSPVVQINDT